MWRLWYSLFPPSIDKLLQKRDVQGLIWALGNPDDTTYQRAANGLVDMDQEAAGPLRATLRNSNEHWLRRKNAAWVLGKMRDQKAIPDLIACLKDPNRTVQQGACMGLGMLGDRSAIDPLIVCLQEAKSLWTKAFAIANVMNITSPNIPEIVVDALVSLLEPIAAWQQQLRLGKVPPDLENELGNVFAMEGEFVQAGLVDPADRVRKMLALFVDRNLLPAFEELGERAQSRLSVLATRPPTSSGDAYLIHYAALALAQIPSAFSDVLVLNASNGNMDGANVMMKASAGTARKPGTQGQTPWQWANTNRHEDLLDLLGQFGIDK